MPAPASGLEWTIAAHEYERMESRRGRRHAYERLNPSSSALVVIDMVSFFVDENPACRAVAPDIASLADQLRERGGTVAWVVPSSGVPTAHADEFYGPEVAAMYAASGGTGTPRDRVWPGFKVRHDDLVVEKSGPSAFFPGRCDLPTELSARGIDTVLVAGTVTNVCCESSVRDAAMLGFRVVMIADLNVGGDFATRSSTFTVVYRSFGDVRTSAEVSELLRGTSRDGA
ncbi:MAG: isochorismatase family cysteine hydrolase [Microlunatus sp.]